MDATPSHPQVNAQLTCTKAAGVRWQGPTNQAAPAQDRPLASPGPTPPRPPRRPWRMNPEPFPPHASSMQDRSAGVEWQRGPGFPHECQHPQRRDEGTRAPPTQNTQSRQPGHECNIEPLPFSPGSSRRSLQVTGARPPIAYTIPKSTPNPAMSFAKQGAPDEHEGLPWVVAVVQKKAVTTCVHRDDVTTWS